MHPSLLIHADHVAVCTVYPLSGDFNSDVSGSARAISFLHCSPCLAIVL